MEFHVDVREVDHYMFYYNMVAEVNKNVIKVIEDEVLKRPMSQEAMNYRNNMLAGGLHSKMGPSVFGMMGQRNQSTGQIEYESALDMKGITASVNIDLAQEILLKAIEYCPVKSGVLSQSGRIEAQADGSCRIYFDCPYAFYVHEYTWRKWQTKDKGPKFLTRAIEYVESLHGYEWYKDR